MLNVNELIKNALKSKNEVELKVYRAVKAEMMNFKTAKNAPEYNEAAEIKILNKMKKQYEDSIKQYLEAHREDLVESETSELEVLSKLIPEPVNERQVYSTFDDYCQNMGLKNVDNFIEIPKNKMGLVIKFLKDKFPYNDGKEIANMVKNYVK